MSHELTYAKQSGTRRGRFSAPLEEPIVEKVLPTAGPFLEGLSGRNPLRVQNQGLRSCGEDYAYGWVQCSQ